MEVSDVKLLSKFMQFNYSFFELWLESKMIVKLHIKKSGDDSVGKIIKAESSIYSVDCFESDVERGVFGHEGVSHWAGFDTRDVENMVREFDKLDFDKKSSIESLVSKKLKIKERSDLLNNLKEKLTLALGEINVRQD